MCTDDLSACSPVHLVHEGPMEARKGTGSPGSGVQMTVKYRVGAGNQIQSSGRPGNALNH